MTGTTLWRMLGFKQDLDIVMETNYLSTSYARILFRHLRLSENTCAPFFAGTNLSFQELMSLDSRVSYRDQIRLFENAISISERPDLGLTVGARFHLSSHGSLGIAIFSSPNLKIGIETLIKYSETRAQFVHFEGALINDEYHIRIRENLDLGKLKYFLQETTVSSIYSAITFFTEIPGFNGRICFNYSQPQYIETYQQSFGDNILFDQPFTEIVFSKSLLLTSSPVADETQHQEAINQCNKLLACLNNLNSTSKHASVSDNVASIIAENPGRLWSLNEIAVKLHFSSRTLIRKLKLENTQFKIIRDNVLKQQTLNYLSDSKLSIECIGDLLGFSDVSSFRRSFKRWFNETPIQLANRLRKTEIIHSDSRS